MRQNPTIFREDKEESKRMHKIMSEKIQDLEKYEKNIKESNQNWRESKKMRENSGKFGRIRRSMKEPEIPADSKDPSESQKIQSFLRESGKIRENLIES
ncbi:hypothetical protein Zmor_007987 [Zophobas morio]|uniref:Uncharacterized protein n=1 Tax=Zophobas morio TaxID=2755281 RepID=A0AA38IWU7_9CUCU|nr:hypothetical protein Zmor_007987 [Zophobas morio]